MKSKSKAFTLVELMTVVTLIGAIAIFALPNYTKTVNRSYEKTASDTLQIILSAQELSKNNGDGYLDTAVSTADVNTKLRLSIVESDGFIYSCDGDNAAVPPIVVCQAARADGTYAVQIANTNTTVCCAAGTCPTLAACP